MRALAAALLVFALASCGAPTQHMSPAPGAAVEATSNALEVRDSWAAPTAGGVDVSAGYLTISNQTAADDALVGASSPRAERVEVHEMTMAGGVMQMRQMQRLAIPAGNDVALASGGKHLMFYGVAQPFALGETIPVRLTFANAGEIDVSLIVRRPSAQQGH